MLELVKRPVPTLGDITNTVFVDGASFPSVLHSPRAYAVLGVRYIGTDRRL